MASLKILAGGESQKARDNARGKLFEKLMAEVLRHHGYAIDKTLHVNYAGMEIDIEGKHIMTNIPLYAECKCYNSPVKSPQLHAFHGKYMTRWSMNKYCHGLFIALPGLNSHAKGFYKDNLETNREITSKLLEEDEVLDAIYRTKAVVTPDSISRLITEEFGTPGDSILLYTDKGYFWIRYVVPPNAGISSEFSIFDAQGNTISDKKTIDYLRSLWPDLNGFRYQPLRTATPIMETQGSEQSVEDIVEVRGSSSCFEYQFPASPEYFVGRQDFLEEVDCFAQDVINETTSSRAILFEGYSGWGKSSLVLSSVARLKHAGHLAVAIDCRSAASSQFPLRLVKYICHEIPQIKKQVFTDNELPNITGFEGAVKTILQIGDYLKCKGKILVIFLDQFENIFFLSDILNQITTLVLRLCDVKSNVVLGFSWKTDIVGSTSDFPYSLRDMIKGSSRILTLTTFKKPETAELLSRLSDELHAPLRSDLRFFLSEFSQGYPWLLKKLCAHVKSQRDARLAQRDIASTLLNVKDLFDEDLKGLSPEEEEILRRIAKIAPITMSEVTEVFNTLLVQNMVNLRLLVRIGTKYDIYWDIFRDYLNTDRLPIQENYILRAQLGSVINATKLLATSKSSISLEDLPKKLRMATKTVGNIVRDMKLLGLASIVDGILKPEVALSTNDTAFEVALRNHIRDVLPRNRLVSNLLTELNRVESFQLKKAANILEDSCPYIKASQKTWTTYARIICSWLDLSDLAIYEHSERALMRYVPSKQVRERRYLRVRHRGQIPFPLIQYRPIEKALERIVNALHHKQPIDWSDFSASAITKTIITLDQLGFVQRKASTMLVTSKVFLFVREPEQRTKLFAESALKMKSFETFINILEEHKERGTTIVELARQVKRELNLHCADSTAEVYVKIMLDWARHSNLAPGVFAKTRKGPFRSRKKASESMPSLFDKN